MNEERQIIEISMDDIIPNRFQPRLVFDQQALNELASSIKIHGIIQPLVVKKVADKYEIIAGERRFKAAGIAGLTKVPCIVMNMSDDESAEVAIIENVQRSDLTPIEEAKSYKKLLDKGYLTQDQLAGRMGKAQSTVANKLRLLNLDEEVQNALLKNKISERHARALLSLKSTYDQKEMLNKIISNKLNVRDTEAEIKKMLTPEEESKVQEVNPISPVSNIDSEPAILETKIDTPQFINIGVPTPVIEEKIDNTVSDNLGKFFTNPIADEKEPLIEEFDIKPTVNINDLIDNTPSEPLVTPNIEPLTTNPMDLFDNTSIPQVEAPQNNALEIRNAINEIRAKIEDLQKLGYTLTTEEYDFEKIYQIVIKLEK